MSLETQIAALVTAANNLTTAVNGKVSEIDQKVNAATDAVPATIRAMASQTFYIDAINGNDGNSGTTPQAALKTANAASSKVVSGSNVALLFKSGQTHEVAFLLRIGRLSLQTYDAADITVKSQRATLKPAYSGVDAYGRRAFGGVTVTAGQIYLTGVNIDCTYDSVALPGGLAPQTGSFIAYTNSQLFVMAYLCDIKMTNIAFAATYSGYSARDLFFHGCVVELAASSTADALLLRALGGSPTYRLDVHSSTLTNIPGGWASILPPKLNSSIQSNVVI